MARFAGMTALVTGAGRGIGFAIAHRLAEEGAAVVIADLDGPAAIAAARTIGAGGGSARGIQMDVTSRSDVQAAVDLAAPEGSLDLLVSNVGVAEEGDFLDVSEEQWARQISATLTGTFVCAQVALPQLTAAARGGRVVFVGSVNGLSAYGHEAYSAAKAGVHSLAANLAVRYGPRGIRFNVVAPGTIVSEVWRPRIAADPTLLDRMAEHYPLRSLGTPDDVAHAALFLLSDEARWITGSVVTVDGGLSAGNVSMMADRTVRRDDA